MQCKIIIHLKYFLLIKHKEYMTVKTIYFIKKSYIMASNLQKHILFNQKTNYWYTNSDTNYSNFYVNPQLSGYFATSEMLEKESKSLSNCVKRFKDFSAQTKEHPFTTHHVYMNPWAGSLGAKLSLRI